MRRLVVVVTLIATPLVAAAPAAATGGHQATVSSAAAVVTVGPARDGLAYPPSAPPVPQARDAATPRQSDDVKSGGETAVLPRHLCPEAKSVSACFAAPAAPAAQTAARYAKARAPPTPA
jgi:hypothetical protein